MSDPTLDELLARARTLEDEVLQLAAHAASHHVVETTSFLAVRANALASEVRTEAGVLTKKPGPKSRGNAPPPTASTSSALASSNIPYFAVMWDTAKRAKSLVAVRHRVTSPKPRMTGAKAKRKSWHITEVMLAPGLRVIPSMGECRKDPQLMVDVIADEGRSWWKVSTLNNRRFLFDLAKEGLGYVGNGEEGGLEEAIAEVMESGDDAEYGDVPILKLVREYMHTAKMHRIRAKAPEVHFVLPRISEEEVGGSDDGGTAAAANAAIKLVLAACRASGAHMHTASTLEPTPPLTPDLLNIMAPSPFAAFTDVLNIDTSVLIALVSDFCHSDVQVQDWFTRSHMAHWEKEQKHRMLDELLPALCGHDLVCTEEVASTFSHIVSSIGTESEVARAAIILSPPSSSPADLISSLQALSNFPIPPTLRLPIVPVPLTPELMARVPQPANDVLANNPDMLHPGLGVLQYGWATGLTTVTANFIATRNVGRDLEFDGRLVDDKDWPAVWVSSASRPLVGVPKTRRVRKHVAQCIEGGVCVCGIDRFHGGRTYESDEDNNEKKE